MAEANTDQSFDPRRTERRVWVPDQDGKLFDSNATVAFGEDDTDIDPMRPSHGYTDSNGKKGKVWLWVVLGVIVVVGGVSAWYFLVHNKTSNDVQELVIDDESSDDLIVEEEVDATEYAPAEPDVTEEPAPAPAPRNTRNVAQPAPTPVTPAARPRTQTIDNTSTPAQPQTPTRRRQTIDDDDTPSSPRRQQMD